MSKSEENFEISGPGKCPGGGPPYERDFFVIKAKSGAISDLFSSKMVNITSYTSIIKIPNFTSKILRYLLTSYQRFKWLIMTIFKKLITFSKMENMIRN